MKLYTFILLVLLIIYVNSTDCEDIQNVSKKKDCNGKLSDDDKKHYSHCCYAEDENGNKACTPITQAHFDSLEALSKAAKELGQESKGKFDCNSNYIKFGFLSLLLSLL